MNNRIARNQPSMFAPWTLLSGMFAGASGCRRGMATNLLYINLRCVMPPIDMFGLNTLQNTITIFVLKENTITISILSSKKLQLVYYICLISVSFTFFSALK